MNSLFRSSILSRALLLAASHAAVACDDGLSGPETSSTETGNPPVLDADAISLEVEGGTSTIVGAPGAVLPGSGTVSAVELRTGEVFHGEVQADGSFTIEVPADGIFYVVVGDDVHLSQVLLQAARDPESVVALGDASVEDAVSEAGLTCFYQQQVAQSAVSELIEQSETSCQSDDDCVLVSADNPCARSCSDVAVSASYAASFASAIAALQENACPAYADGECASQPRDCGEPAGESVARCRTGGCVVESAQLEELCGGPQVQLIWRTYEQGSEPASAPEYSYAGLTYGSLQRVDAAGTRCLSELALCDWSGEAQTDAEIRRAAAHADVEAVLIGGDQVFAAEAGSTRMQIDITTYGAQAVRVDLPLCTDCQVPQGVLALAELLDGLGEQASWSSCYRSE